MNRREFIQSAAGAAVVGTGVFAHAKAPVAANIKKPLHAKLPKWRGFNLLEKFNKGRNHKFVETDFQWLSDWGFDFVRLPMDYRCWTDGKNPYKLDEKILAHIDQAVEFGKKYGVHVSLNLHRAPGYTVAHPPEKLNLWKDPEAQKQFAFQWATFAKRYRGIPSKRLSFGLVNEPARIDSKTYASAAKVAIAAVRQVDPDRLIISDGLQWGRDPVWELVSERVAQSTRGYDPFKVSHYKASWAGRKDWGKPPTWPMKRRQGKKDIVEGRQWVYDNRIKPWKKLAAAGVGVHVGEWGAYKYSPHDVVLRWMKDLLELWTEADFGWALWNFRGSFGVLDSGRTDVKYEDYKSHKLDRKMLDLLRAH
ncbi:MAG: cellulase family glycosylhydrolase [Phycisphaerae bacterium]|jgi:endoglucanase|nr:cellulase family glycosylhydrolase [Phycisphaerae bacterium]